MNPSDDRKRDAWLREMEKRGVKTRLITCGAGVTLDDVYRWLTKELQKEDKE